MVPSILLINALLGVAVSLLYYPDSPFYIFPGVKLEELWLWSKYSAFISALLLIFALLSADTGTRGREAASGMSIFATTLQGIMNLAPAITYLFFLHGATIAQITLRGNTFTVSLREVALHVALIILSWATTAWLTFRVKKTESTEIIPLVDLNTYHDKDA